MPVQEPLEDTQAIRTGSHLSPCGHLQFPEEAPEEEELDDELTSPEEDPPEEPEEEDELEEPDEVLLEEVLPEEEEHAPGVTDITPASWAIQLLL